MKDKQVWLSRILVLIPGGLLVASWFLPWWTARVQELHGSDHVVMHPWGVDVNSPKILSYMPPTVDLNLPDFFAPAMWAYLGLVTLALLFALFAKNGVLKVWKVRFTLPNLIIGVVGLSYIGALITAGVITTIRLADAGMPLMGKITVVVGSDIGTGTVFSNLGLGYWLGAAAGVLLVIVALLRDRIIHIGERVPISEQPVTQVGGGLAETGASVGK